MALKAVFFDVGETLVDEERCVGDRVDNDVLPAQAAGMVAVHVRRGPWGYLQHASAADIRVDSLAALPEALGL